MDYLLNILLMLGLQILVYAVFLRPRIMSWGATPEEVNMSLIGDDLAPAISATRAILINAPIAEVWKWIIQLGADRGGFFSYAFIEKILGYEMCEPESEPKFSDMDVGRIVPASLDESKSIIKFSWPVVAVEPGKAFVLQEWGAFVLREIGPAQTRLIVRTHGQDTRTLWSKIDDFVGMALHYIMERRMLLGFKVQAETGAPLSSASDNAWLLGIILSAVGIALMIFTGGGIQAIILSTAYGVIWLWTLLLVDPRPLFSMILCLIIAATLAWL